MLNMLEVSETNSMIEQEKLDVRTITMGINLLDLSLIHISEPTRPCLSSRMPSSA